MKSSALVIAWPLIAAILIWPDNVPCGAAGNGASQAARRGQPNNRWRYVWHNDHWWYWSQGRQWSYFGGRRWETYRPGQPLAGSPTMYRKAPAFERPPAAPPQPPRSWSAEAMVGESGLSSTYYFEGGQAVGGEPLPVLRGFDTTPFAVPSLGGTSDRAGEPITPIVPRAGRTGGGAFGGPTGKSFGAGSAAGGASTPQ